MEAEDFVAFLTEQGWSDAEAMRQLGIGSRNTLASYKENGGPLWLGLACAALAAGLPAWKGRTVPVYGFKVWDQNLGDFTVPQSKRTAESIGRIAGAEILPGSAEFVMPEEIDEHGRYFPPDHADLDYLEQLLVPARANEIPPEMIPDLVRDITHLHATQGHGDRGALLRLFRAKAPHNPTSERIASEMERLL